MKISKINIHQKLTFTQIHHNRSLFGNIRMATDTTVITRYSESTATTVDPNLIFQFKYWIELNSIQFI